MSFDVDTRTIFLTLTGSHAYGTARPGSDVDVRGCCVAPMRVRLSFRTQFEQFTWVPGPAATLARAPLGPVFAAAIEAARTHASAGPSLDGVDVAPDVVIYDLAKLVGLCAQANPNMLELLYVDEREILHRTPIWDRLRGRRDEFLSQKVRHTFAGYAQGQLKRIQRHREWLLAPPTHAPTRAEFDLPEHSPLSADDRNRIDESITKIIRGWSVDEAIELPGAERDVLRERLREFWAAALSARPAVDLDALTGDGAGDGPGRFASLDADADAGLDEKLADIAGSSLGLASAVLDTLRQERRYRSARRRWEQFQRWQRERNPKRSALEAEHGYDTKHGMHLIRLLRMGLEILRDGEVRVRRSDAAELLEIRAGALDYEGLLAEANKLEQGMREALKTTSLPREVDEAALDELLIELLEDSR